MVKILTTFAHNAEMIIEQDTYNCKNAEFLAALNIQTSTLVSLDTYLEIIERLDILKLSSYINFKIDIELMIFQK